MLSIRTALRDANRILQDLNGVFPGDDSHQKFKWCWSSDLWALVPVLNDNGEQRFTFTCACGTDVKVHSINCAGITEANILMSKCFMTEEYGPLASYRNMYVLCRWVPPPSPEEWKSSMGTVTDYPAAGRYLPVSNNMATVVIPPRTDPDEYAAVSRLVVRMMIKNIENYKLAQQDTSIKRELPRMDAKGNMIEEPHKDAKFWKIRERIHDSMSTYDPAATVGYGGKTAQGHKPKTRVFKSDRSLADPTGPLARELKRPVEELAKELAKRN